MRSPGGCLPRVSVCARITSPGARNTTSRCGTETEAGSTATVPAGTADQANRGFRTPAESGKEKARWGTPHRKIPQVRDETELYRALDLDFIASGVARELRRDRGRRKGFACHDCSRPRTCAAPSIVTRPQVTATTHSRKWPQRHRSWACNISGLPITAAVPSGGRTRSHPPARADGRDPRPQQDL